MSSSVVAPVAAARVAPVWRSSCGRTAGRPMASAARRKVAFQFATGEVAAGTGGEQETFWRSGDVLLQVVLQYRRDPGRKGHCPMSGVGLGLADHPPALDAPHGTLDAQSTAGQDVGPA